MAACPDSIKRLVERFTHQLDQVRSPAYNETRLRIDFVNPMFAELGWDIDNAQGFAEQYREVVHEDRVRVAGANKAPDYSFRVGGTRKFFLEAKKPSVNVKTDWEPAYQLRRYAWSAKLAASLLTDFEEFAVYDTRIKPKQLERASVARREYITYDQYEDRWSSASPFQETTIFPAINWRVYQSPSLTSDGNSIISRTLRAGCSNCTAAKDRASSLTTKNGWPARSTQPIAGSTSSYTSCTA